MFTELYAVARHTALQISVSPDGARLNVLIIPKPGDDADEGSALTKPIQAIGTPEELDRELPAKLAEYCAAINDLRLKIDMPIEAITAEAVKGGAKKKANSPAARKPTPAPTPKKKAAPKPVKPARPAATPEAARRARRTQEISAAQARQKTAAAQETTPDTERSTAADMGSQSACGLDNAGNERPSGGSSPKTPASAAVPAAGPAKKSKRATREECLADLRAYLAECASTGVTITRALFLGHNTTGRSYERKFKSWEEFLAEGRKAPDEWEDKFPVPGEETPKSGDDAPPAKETLSTTAFNPAAQWPFPTKEPAAAPEAPAARNPTAPLFPE